MNQTPSAKRLDIFMADILPLYSDFVEHLRQGNDATIESFQELFDRRHIEYLHYCGSSIAEPFLLDVERDVFQLAAAYLCFPQKIFLPKVRLFSLLLLFFLYGTQPLLDNKDLPPFPIVIAADVFDSLFSHPPSSRKHLVSSSTATTPGSSVGVEPFSLEEQIALSLYSHNAFSIQPSVDNKVYVAALLRAHECGKQVPIFSLELERKSSPIPPLPYSSPPLNTVGGLHSYSIHEKMQHVSDNRLRKMLLAYQDKWEKNKNFLQRKN